jgi:hypothetical protein
MKNTLRTAAFVVLAFAAPLAANAQAPGAHPAYVHAMSDLRAARFLIEHHPSDWKQSLDEHAAVAEIDRALHDLTQAAIDDGKNPNDHPPVDERPDQPGRLHQALDFLHKAHDDIAQEEDNGWANGLRSHSIHHIDVAIGKIRHAIHE